MPFFAGDCDDDFVDFLVALFIRSFSLSEVITSETIVIFLEFKLKEIYHLRRAIMNEASRSQRRACLSRPRRAASGVV